MTRIGIVAELGQETRVAATPTTVGQLLGLGYEVVVEKGAGESASFPDHAYAEAGAVVVGADEAWGSEVVLRINPPTGEEIGRLAAGATLIGSLSPGCGRSWWRLWPRGRSRRWRWTRCRGSRGRSRWTC